MGHKYLEELENEHSMNDYTDDERAGQWAAEREIYGFDSRETWSLDWYFYRWLYEHLRMYQDSASEIVDLHYHKFNFKGHIFYQNELIEMMLERIRFACSEEYDEWNENDAAYVREIGEIWAIVLPAMWW